MKIIHKKQARKFKNSESCLAFEYPSGSKKMSGAVVNLSGRYPNEGKLVNLECAELVYIISGSGYISVNNKRNKISEGDMILINPKEKVFWEGKMSTLAVSCPAWNSKQHKIIK